VDEADLWAQQFYLPCCGSSKALSELCSLFAVTGMRILTLWREPEYTDRFGNFF
jgi:hypothetical protein